MASGTSDFQGADRPYYQTHHRKGLTIVELLVSVALTLIVILAIVRVFDLLGGNVTQSRSILELSAQLRDVSTQIQNDLDRLTAPPEPQRNPSASMGYFEIVEGVRNERDNDGDGEFDINAFTMPNSAPVTSILVTSKQGTLPGTNQLAGLPLYLQQVRGILGDTDDLFMATIRSDDEPFKGRLYNPATGEYLVVQSHLAEVAYWLAPVEINNQFGEFALVRRLFLIQPELPDGVLNTLMANMVVGSVEDLQNFVAINDISMRPEYNPAANRVTMRANTLADLRLRRNRFAHWGDLAAISEPNQLMSLTRTFPDYLNPLYLVRSSDVSGGAASLRDGNGFLVPDNSDVIAQDVLGFDLRVFDPIAPVYRPAATSRYVVTPQDPGFYTYLTSNPPNPTDPAANYGAYVDLGYAWTTNGRISNNIGPSHFSELPHDKSQLHNPGIGQFARIYDTWTEEYEMDGIDQTPSGFPGHGVADEGRNGTEESLLGMPNNNSNVVDDYYERETVPPYDRRLQGMEVILRLREASSNQVRQASVVTNFDE